MLRPVLVRALRRRSTVVLQKAAQTLTTGHAVILIEENRLLRRQMSGRRLRLTDDDRRRLAVRAYRLGREALRDVATIVAPSCAKTPPKPDHPPIGGSTQPEEGVRLRQFGPVDIVLEPAQRLGHASAMDPLPPLAFFCLLFSGWVNRQQHAVIDYLVEKNRVLRAAGSRRLRLGGLLNYFTSAA